MASSAREALRKAYADTSGLIGRLVPTLFLTCISVMIISGVDDQVMLAGGEVSTPFIGGKARFEIFMIIAPISILLLRLYIYLQMQHFDRLREICRRKRLRRPLTLTAENAPALLAAGAVALHVMPAATIAFIGYRTSALYPIYGLTLYGVAVAMVLWSAWELARAGTLQRVAFGLLLPPLVIGTGAVLMHNSLLSESPEGYETCDLPLPEAIKDPLRPFIRTLDVAGGDFERADLAADRLWCALMRKAELPGADLSEAIFTQVDMNDALLADAEVVDAWFLQSTMNRSEFPGATVYDGVFVNTAMVGAKLKGIEALTARFFKVNLHAADFRDSSIEFSDFDLVQMPLANFTGVPIDDSSFDDVDAPGISFRRASLQNVEFVRSYLYAADFRGATLTRVNFNDVTLQCADFRGATFEDTQIVRAASPSDAGAEGSDQEASIAYWRDADLRTIRVDPEDRAAFLALFDNPQNAGNPPLPVTAEQLGIDYDTTCRPQKGDQ